MSMIFKVWAGQMYCGVLVYNRALGRDFYTYYPKHGGTICGFNSITHLKQLDLVKVTL